MGGPGSERILPAHEHTACEARAGGIVLTAVLRGPRPTSKVSIPGTRGQWGLSLTPVPLRTLRGARASPCGVR